MIPLIPDVPRKWASPKEFDEEKLIEIVNFEALSLEEVTERDGKPPKFPPADGIIRRLTFLDGQTERSLDINSSSFQRDLSVYGIKVGDSGRLKRTKNTSTPGYKWTWLKIDTS